nr:hypothetical protein [Streptomyces atratus]
MPSPPRWWAPGRATTRRGWRPCTCLGRSWPRRWPRPGRSPLESLCPLAAGLAEGLDGIHTAGVVHRDLKPANVLLVADGPRVFGFSIARALDCSPPPDPGQRGHRHPGPVPRARRTVTPVIVRAAHH